MAERGLVNKVYSIKHLPGEQAIDGYKCGLESLFRQSESCVLVDAYRTTLNCPYLYQNKQTKKSLKSYLLITDN